MSDIVPVRGVINAVGQSVIVGTASQPTVGIQLEGTWVGTLHIQEALSGDDWIDAQVTNAAGVPVSAIVTANGRFFVAAAGRGAIQVTATAWPSGTVTAVLLPTQGSSGGSSGGGGAVTVADGADVTQGTTTDPAALTDTSNTTIVAFWKRLLSRLTTLLPQTASGLKVDNSAVTQPVSGTFWQATQPVSAASLPLPTGAAADATLGTTNTQVGGLTETAPATDTASSGLNGRLQRVAQRLSSLIALLPTALISNRLDVNLGAAPATVTVQGAAAAGAAVAGNPVATGAKDGSGNAQFLTTIGAGATFPLSVAIVNSSGNLMSVGSQAADGNNGALYYPQQSNVYNATSYDRLRNNIDVTLLASAARTTPQSGTITTYNLGAIKFILDMTVITAGPSVTLTISETDLASGKNILLLSGAAVVTAVTNEYTVDPMIPAVANVSAQKRVPRTIFWQITANNANSGTYSLGSMQLPA